MHLKGYSLLAVIAVLLCSADCGVPYMIYSAITPPRVTPSPQWERETEYVPHVVYRLRQPVFLIKRPTNIVGSFPQYSIVLPADSEAGVSVPASADAYDASKPDKWPQVVVLLPAGELLRFEEMRYVETHRFANPLFAGADVPEPHPLFTILDPNAVHIGLVDGSGIPGNQYNPNSDYLEHVPDTDTAP